MRELCLVEMSQWLEPGVQSAGLNTCPEPCDPGQSGHSHLLMAADTVRARDPLRSSQASRARRGGGVEGREEPLKSSISSFTQGWSYQTPSGSSGVGSGRRHPPGREQAGDPLPRWGWSTQTDPEG